MYRDELEHALAVSMAFIDIGSDHATITVTSFCAMLPLWYLDNLLMVLFNTWQNIKLTLANL